jgi:hypothetical protein
VRYTHGQPDSGVEAQIAGAKTATIAEHRHHPRNDGVARVEGLGGVMLNEMLDLGKGVTDWR